MADLTLYDAGIKIMEVIRDNAEILSYCNTNFSTPHCIYYGSTGSEAPPKSDYPAFMIVPWNKDRSEDTDRRLYSFTVALAIEDDNKTTLTDGNNVKTVEYRGPKVLEDLLDYAMVAIRAMCNEIYYDDKILNIDPIEYFPVFYGELALTIGFAHLIGGYEPAIT